MAFSFFVKRYYVVNQKGVQNSLKIPRVCTRFSWEPFVISCRKSRICLKARSTQQKLPAILLCLGEPPRRFLLLLIFISFLIFILFLLYLHFIFDLYFVDVVLHLSMLFIHIFFSTSSLTLPWTIAGFLHPFYTFSQVHRRVICKFFIFNHPINLLAAGTTPLSGHFFTHRRFLPYAPSPTF